MTTASWVAVMMGVAIAIALPLLGVFARKKDR